MVAMCVYSEQDHYPYLAQYFHDCCNTCASSLLCITYLICYYIQHLSKPIWDSLMHWILLPVSCHDDWLIVADCWTSLWHSHLARWERSCHSPSQNSAGSVCIQASHVAHLWSHSTYFDGRKVQTPTPEAFCPGVSCSSAKLYAGEILSRCDCAPFHLFIFTIINNQSVSQTWTDYSLCHRNCSYTCSKRSSDHVQKLLFCSVGRRQIDITGTDGLPSKQCSGWGVFVDNCTQSLPTDMAVNLSISRSQLCGSLPHGRRGISTSHLFRWDCSNRLIQIIHVVQCQECSEMKITTQISFLIESCVSVCGVAVSRCHILLFDSSISWVGQSSLITLEVCLQQISNQDMLRNDHWFQCFSELWYSTCTGDVQFAFCIAQLITPPSADSVGSWQDSIFKHRRTMVHRYRRPDRHV